MAPIFLVVEDNSPINRSGRQAMTSKNNRGFFGRAIDGIVESRTRSAARFVNGVLLSLSDDELQARGLNRAQLQRTGVRFYV
jgi:hypothetical protein